jgi:hypothetical protein
MAPEPTLLEAFKENPVSFVVALFCASLGVTLGTLASILHKKGLVSTILAVAAVTMGLASAAAGALGAAQFSQQADAAIATPGLSVSDRARIVGDARARAIYPFATGAVGAVPAMLLGGTAIILRIRRK